MPKDIVNERNDFYQRLGFDEIIVIGEDAYLAEDEHDVSRNRDDYELILADGHWAFEDKRVDIIYNLEDAEREDFMHHRASGMNHVLAKQAAQDDIKVAFNFSLLYDQEMRDVILGRMMQNVKLCRKFDVDMVIASFADHPQEMRAPMELRGFGETIGMHPEEAKQAVDW